jgi:hypothetical protein
MEPWSNMRHLGLILILTLTLAGCTDAATRLAHDLEREAEALRRSGQMTRTFTHKPQSLPDGVTGAYTVTFKAGPVRLGSGFLTFSKGPYEQWHRTTYHMRFVEVPRDLNIRKAAGEPIVIVLTRTGDAVRVTELR